MMENVINHDINWLLIATAAVLLISCGVGYYKGFIKEVVSTFFVVLALILAGALNPYMNDFLMKQTPVYETLREKCRAVISEQLSEKEETEEESGSLIEGLPLPSVLKNGMLENNNVEMYHFLAVDTVSDYMAGYAAGAVLNGISFLISYFAASLAMHILVQALELIARLPVIRRVNRFAGIFVGALRGLLLIWLAFLVITICFNTQWGKECLRLIEGDQFLNFLYEKNKLAELYLCIFKGK